MRKLFSKFFVRPRIAVAKATQDECVAGSTVSVASVKDILDLDKSTVSRRLKQAMSEGYVINDELAKGRPMQLRLGDPMPEKVEVLLHPDKLRGSTSAPKKDPTACWM